MAVDGDSFVVVKEPVLAPPAVIIQPEFHNNSHLCDGNAVIGGTAIGRHAERRKAGDN
jgi:hypothetical protein